MARANTPLHPEPVYRAVVLWRFPGMYYPQSEHEVKTGRPPVALPPEKTYTNGDGTEIKYHNYFCNGPYSRPGAAKGRVTAEINGYYGKDWEPFVVYAEVESSTGIWTPVAPKK